MSSSFGERLKITIFGQSHSEAVGVVIDGLPAGEPISLEHVQHFLERRAPGRNVYSSSRREKDIPRVLSGLLDGKTCGAPLCAVIENTNAHPEDYAQLKDLPRPGHADFTAWAKYGGANDCRGGGHFSGRLTAPLCFAGAVCIQVLERRGIHIGAHILSIRHIADRPFDPATVDKETFQTLKEKKFPVLEDSIGMQMQGVIAEAKAALDSVGGVVECAVTGLPVGIGEPMFDGLESRLAAALFAIPAVKAWSSEKGSVQPPCTVRKTMMLFTMTKAAMCGHGQTTMAAAWAAYPAECPCFSALPSNQRLPSPGNRKAFPSAGMRTACSALPAGMTHASCRGPCPV